MCVLFVYVNKSATGGQLKLILASNRDELFRRPAKAASFWDNGNILAGQDLTVGKEGGTWLGVSRNGRVAVLLNDSRKEVKADNLSRGSLVGEFLESEEPRKHLDNLLKTGEQYSPFQLVTCDLKNKDVIMRYFSNIDKKLVEFEDGVYGFSNGSLEQPYVKASSGKDLLSGIVEKLGKETDNTNALANKLLGVLRSTDTNLPDRNLEVLQSSKPKHIIPALSAINVKLPEEFDFGTRTHTVITVDGCGMINFHEWQHDASPDCPNHFSFQIR